MNDKKLKADLIAAIMKLTEAEAAEVLRRWKNLGVPTCGHGVGS